MLELIAKDWTATRFYLGLIVPWYLLIISQLAFLPGGLPEAYVLLAWMVGLAPAVLDLISDAESTICSLPTTRGRIVAGRYLFTVTGCGLSLVLCITHISLLKRLGLLGADAYPWLPTLPGMSAFLASAAVLLGVLLPLTFAFGLIRGALAAGSLACLAAIFQVIHLWGEPISSWQPGWSLESLALVLSRKPLRLGLLWALVTVGLSASCWIAGRLYARRDL